MRRHLLIITLLNLALSTSVFAAETTVAERQLKEKGIRVEEEGAKKEKLYIGSFDELSWIKQGNKKGYWRLLTSQAAYRVNDALLPYLNVDAWERFGDYDQTISAGSYIIFKDKSYLRSEIGWGANIDYLYEFQTTLEYEHKLIKDYFWNFTYRYLNYPDDDVYIFSPGLRYYFGDHFLSIFYNASSTESRGVAQWGTIKGNFALNKRLNFWIGSAVGERLYDILPLKASEQYGYIFFTGFDCNIYKNLFVRLGYSYSKEEPSFIKRSLDFGASIKF